MEAPRTGRPAAAGPATAQAGAAAASVVAALARQSGDGAGAAARAALPSAEPDEANERRDFALGVVLDRAAEAPLAIAEACADVAAVARALAERLDPTLAADFEASARLAVGAARAAAHLVEINLVVGHEDARARRARSLAELR